jgi:hypothetical protein
MNIFAPIGMAIFGISQAVGHVLNWHSKDEDRKQQQELATLRQEEAKRAYESMLARDERQAERAIEIEQVRSQFRLEEAAIAHAQAKEMQIEAERRVRELANSPFRYSLDEAHSRVVEHTRGGQVPAFLIAPFQYDNPADGTPVFTTAIRETWRRVPWSGDMNLFQGLITRPLETPDVDLQTIRLALHDLPVIVVYGHVQANARLWVSVTAWNLGDASGTRVLDMSLPPMMLLAPGDDAIARRLEFEDTTAAAISLVAGEYADWFHVLRSGRLPQLHNQLPDDLSELRRSLAANGAEIYGATISRGMASETRARLAQAVILAEGGLTDNAVATARPALARRQLSQGEFAELSALLQRLDQGPASPALASEIDRMRKHILVASDGMEALA